MSTPVIGDPNPQFNREEIRFGPNVPGEYSVGVEGLSERVKALIPQLAAAGASGVYLRDRSPVATLDYTFGSMEAANSGGSPTVENPIPVWTLSAAQSDKSLLDPLSQSVFTSEEIDKIDTYLNNPQTTDNNSGVVRPTFTGGSVATKSLLLKLLINKMTSRIFFAPELTVSRVISSSYTITAALTNVNRIISSSSLIAQEQIPSDLQNILPINTTFGGNTVFLSSELAYGWLKQFPKLELAGSSQRSLSQSWLWGLWPPVVYGAVI
jgi:hypothetical protein